MFVVRIPSLKEYCKVVTALSMFESQIKPGHAESPKICNFLQSAVDISATKAIVNVTGQRSYDVIRTIIQYHMMQH